MAQKDGSRQAERQLVVFNLAGERYGVDIGSVREIIRMQEITKVPRTQEFVQGVINLRGHVIPIVDLRKRFDLPAGDETKETRIVVVETGGNHIGVIVDAVEHVMRISQDAIEPPSAAITASDSSFLVGIGKMERGMTILLDLEKVLTTVDKGAAEPAGAR